MTARPLLPVLLAALMATSAHAQQIYQSVGPDGKIVFSDKPPADTNTKVKVLGKPEEPKHEAEASPAAAAASTQKAISADKPATAATKPALDPAVDKALTGIMLVENLVVQTGELCSQTLPTSFKKYKGAVDSWKQRHATALAQKQRVLALVFDPERRQKVEAGVKAVNQMTMLPVTNASTARRIEWCDASTNSINRDEGVNIDHHTAILTAYQR